MKNKKTLWLCLLIIIFVRIVTLNDTVIPYAPLLTKKGIEEKDKGHTLQALKYFNKAFYHDPNYADGIFQLITVEPDELKRRNLIHQLAVSNERNSNFNPVIFSLGMFYFQNKEYEKANYYFTKAVYNYPFYPLPNYYSGIVFLKQGNWDGVLKAYIRLRSTPPDFNSAPWAAKLKTETEINNTAPHQTLAHFLIQKFYFSQESLLKSFPNHTSDSSLDNASEIYLTR